jgi:hypothetical protein
MRFRFTWKIATVDAANMATSESGKRTWVKVSGAKAKLRPKTVKMKRNST